MTKVIEETLGATELIRLFHQWPQERVSHLIRTCSATDVGRALEREERSFEDLIALLSFAARDFLEPMAVEAHRLTRQYFGRTIALYAPIYLSNICAVNCPYCGFSSRSARNAQRTTLTPDALRRECEALAAAGFDTVLLLTGEAPRIASVDYLAQAVTTARAYFSSVSIEVYALELEDYVQLNKVGLEGVTLYMETYDPLSYQRLHRRGIKRNYKHRLTALDRAGAAGVRRLNIGVLLGLFDWRVDGFYTALHARHLQKTCWRSTIAVSFPRLRNVPNGFQIPAPIGDTDLVQLMLALRLFLPQAGFTLSTRENANLRDKLIPLGVTMMSAGSSTRPGGYTAHNPNITEQFPTEDRRSPEQVVNAIIRAGYDPVWKDSDKGFYSF